MQTVAVLALRLFTLVSLFGRDVLMVLGGSWIIPWLSYIGLCAQDMIVNMGNNSIAL